MATESVNPTTTENDNTLQLRRLAEDAYCKLNAALPTLTAAIRQGVEDDGAVEREQAGWLAVWAIQDAHDTLEKVWKGEV